MFDDDDDIRFYQEEKSKFDELLNKFGWTQENLLKEVGGFCFCDER